MEKANKVREEIAELLKKIKDLKALQVGRSRVEGVWLVFFLFVGVLFGLYCLCFVVSLLACVLYLFLLTFVYSIDYQSI